MGGTFDPIHYGHLVAAEEARCQFLLEKVYFVPTGIPPHKKRYSVTSGEHRFLMASLATSNHPDFICSRIEINRPEPSYSVVTLKAFKSKFQKAKIYFITGSDAVKEIFSWHRAEELYGLCEFIAASRPGYQISLPKTKKKNVIPRIHTLEIPALAISSSAIRRRVKHNKPIRYLLPASVETYIYKNGLYK